MATTNRYGVACRAPLSAAPPTAHAAIAATAEPPDTVMAYMVMLYIVMLYVVMLYVVMACIVMVYIVMATAEPPDTAGGAQVSKHGGYGIVDSRYDS